MRIKSNITVEPLQSSHLSPAVPLWVTREISSNDTPCFSKITLEVHGKQPHCLVLCGLIGWRAGTTRPGWREKLKVYCRVMENYYGSKASPQTFSHCRLIRARWEQFSSLCILGKLTHHNMLDLSSALKREVREYMNTPVGSAVTSSAAARL